jgi:protein SCO1/2
MKRLLLAAFALLATLGLATACLAAAAPAQPLPGDSLYQLPAPMTDQAGRAFDWRARRGRPQLVAMFYASCPYMCPLLIDSGKAVQRELAPAQRARLDILFVSIDPEHDTPVALAALAKKRGLDAQRWTLAQPRPQDVRALAGVLGVRYRALADGQFNHTSALVLLDADGRVAARTEKVGTVPDPEFLAAVRAQVASPPSR